MLLQGVQHLQADWGEVVGVHHRHAQQAVQGAAAAGGHTGAVRGALLAAGRCHAGPQVDALALQNTSNLQWEKSIYHWVAVAGLRCRCSQQPQNHSKVASECTAVRRRQPGAHAPAHRPVPAAAAALACKMSILTSSALQALLSFLRFRCRQPSTPPSGSSPHSCATSLRQASARPTSFLQGDGGREGGRMNRARMCSTCGADMHANQACMHMSAVPAVQAHKHTTHPPPRPQPLPAPPSHRCTRSLV